jgi:hypothetical protein
MKRDREFEEMMRKAGEPTKPAEDRRARSAEDRPERAVAP